MFLHQEASSTRHWSCSWQSHLACLRLSAYGVAENVSRSASHICWSFVGSEIITWCGPRVVVLRNLNLLEVASWEQLEQWRVVWTCKQRVSSYYGHPGIELDASKCFSMTRSSRIGLTLINSLVSALHSHLVHYRLTVIITHAMW